MRNRALLLTGNNREIQTESVLKILFCELHAKLNCTLNISDNVDKMHNSICLKRLPPSRKCYVKKNDSALIWPSNILLVGFNYLGVRTYEVFLGFVTIMFVLSIFDFFVLRQVFTPRMSPLVERESDVFLTRTDNRCWL